MYAWVKTMRAQGVPINGIGEQGHLDTQYGFSGAKMQADLARYASLGLKVAITEADVRTFVETTDSLQTPTDSLAQFAQPFEFDHDAQGVPRGEQLHLLHHLGRGRRRLVGTGNVLR